MWDFFIFKLILYQGWTIVQSCMAKMVSTIMLSPTYFWMVTAPSVFGSL